MFIGPDAAALGFTQSGRKAMVSNFRNLRRAGLILLAAGAFATGSVGTASQRRPSTCPASGNSKAPFYGVTASHVGEGKQLHVGGNYRVRESNRKLTLVETGESAKLLRLKLRSIRSSGHPAGCPHFGGSFDAAASVQRVQITDWKANKITVRVARPRHT